MTLGLPSVQAQDDLEDLACYTTSQEQEFLEPGEPMVRSGTYDGREATYTFIVQGIVLSDDLNEPLTAQAQQGAEPKSKIQGYTGTWLITWVCTIVEEIIDCVDEILRLDPRCTGP